MVHRRKAVFFLRPLQQREFCNPYKSEFIFVQKLHLFCQFQTKCSKNAIYNFVLICSKQKQISGFSFHGFHECFHLFLCHKFRERRFQTAILMDCNISKSLCSVIFGKGDEFINFLTRHCALSPGIDTANASTVFDCPFEYRKLTVFYNICDVMKFHAKTQIRLIRTKTIHCLLPGHSLDWKLHIHIQNFFKQFCKESLIYINNIIHVHER